MNNEETDEKKHYVMDNCLTNVGEMIEIFMDYVFFSMAVLIKAKLDDCLAHANSNLLLFHDASSILRSV